MCDLKAAQIQAEWSVIGELFFPRSNRALIS